MKESIFRILALLALTYVFLLLFTGFFLSFALSGLFSSGANYLHLTLAAGVLIGFIYSLRRIGGKLSPGSRKVFIFILVAFVLIAVGGSFLAAFFESLK